jgi:HD-like signal output (HDOD) protein
MRAQSSPTSAGDRASPNGAERDVAFTFVQALAAELSGAKVELPGFPHVVMRVQRDLRAAVARVGVDTVRSATIAFAIRQLQEAPSLRGLEMQLGVLWRRSVQMASLCYVVARRLTTVNADSALLAGLLQGIGRLYILTRASRYPSLFCDPAAYQAIEHDWHLSIAAALLENWGIADDIVQAVHESENLERDSRGAVTLADVVVVGTVLAELNGDSSALAAQLQCAKPLQRLRLDRLACERFLAESAQEIDALRDALG